MVLLQMVSGMRQEASWRQGSAAPPYTTLTLVLCQALQAASQATPPEISSRPEFVTLATSAMLSCLAQASSIQPTHSNSNSCHHDQGEGHSGNGEGPADFEQVLPPGCRDAGVQQLQTASKCVCQAGRQLFKSCSGVVQAQMGTAFALAALTIIQCASPGVISIKGTSYGSTVEHPTSGKCYSKLYLNNVDVTAAFVVHLNMLAGLQTFATCFKHSGEQSMRRSKSAAASCE